MDENAIFLGLTTIVVLGIGAQWVARRAGFPGLLLLLPAGLLAGGVFGLVRPQEMFGDTLFPLVTFLVALLLFQSGLQLRLSDLPSDARRPVLRLVGIGGAVTLLGASFACLWILGVSTELAFLLGAIIVVSGPTVVGPLLNVVRPRRPTGAILNWEGTFLDPIGATLGVVILNLILAADREGANPVLEMLARLGLGVLVGVVAAALLVFVMARFLVPDSMEAAVALMFAAAAFGVADIILSEAGLFATVTLGFIAANQRVVPTSRIRGFGETLEVLIIGILFILLGALVDLDALATYAIPTLVIVLVLVVVVRPLSVALALVRTKLPWRDRVLIGGLDPRGIVAAATAAQFSVALTAAGIASDFLLPVVFGVILGTGVIYALGAGPLVRALKVAEPAPTGIGIIGDDRWLGELARVLHERGIPVLLVSSREDAAAAAAAAAGDAPRISMAHSVDEVVAALREAGLSQVLIADGPDARLTVLSAALVGRLGRRRVLRLPDTDLVGIRGRIPRGATARPFARGTTRQDIDERLAAGARIALRSDGPTGDALVLATISGGVVDFRDGAAGRHSDERVLLTG
ncbi:cation:proton antiporter domain-containing protein [Microbacterium aquimaris]|uniref:Cation:proton antiporter n=1 Tax=Microbacterium aquimaris TaxID=459816 RepID=A0ABU5N318_9MICO|nr:cation:proton antiporter [Microbacterium aquimaris]MDZ8160446.1 cation:proton antiporter [Microbacterium aquimaris]